MPTPTLASRLAIREPPAQLAIMGQQWHHLLFLHWEVDVARLRALVPGALALDTFEGRAFVGVTPFTLTGVRPLWLPSIPGLSSFHEVNVRTYVHLDGEGPGVWFFSLDTNSLPTVLGARAVYRLPYVPAAIDLDAGGAGITFDSRRRIGGARCRARYRGVGPGTAAAPGTLAFFLLERYLLYTFIAGRLCSARVAHDPYIVQDARVDELDESLIAEAGIARPDASPLMHYARSMQVSVHRPRRA